ncbi:MAG: hypothetical protein ACREJ5_25615 [Geminicoccaceae bacterium]
MEQRVTRLEAHFEYIRDDLDEIKAEQRSFSSKLGAHEALLNDIRVQLAKRPTTGQYWGMIGIVGAIALATVAIIITGIVGGLGVRIGSRPVLVTTAPCGLFAATGGPRTMTARFPILYRQATRCGDQRRLGLTPWAAGGGGARRTAPER